MLTDKEKEFTELYMSGMLCTDIAARLKIAPSSVAYYIKKYGLSRPKVKRKQMYEVDKTELLRRYHDGESYADIARHFGFKTCASVQMYLAKFGEERVRYPARKIDDEKLVALIESGKKQKEVAEELGVPASSISRKVRALGIFMRRGQPPKEEIAQKKKIKKVAFPKATPPPKVFVDIDAPPSSNRPKVTSALLAEIAQRGRPCAS